MKGEFVIDFIGNIFEAVNEIGFGFLSQPIRYKGIRVGRRYKTGYANLVYRKIIKPKSNGEFIFTAKGKEWFRGSLFHYHKKLGLQWDGKWRIVIFDIPQEFNLQRDRLRGRLKLFGFKALQKSVFVYPYNCEEEVALYCKKLKISDYVNIILADSIGHMEGEIKKIYDL